MEHWHSVPTLGRVPYLGEVVGDISRQTLLTVVSEKNTEAPLIKIFVDDLDPSLRWVITPILALAIDQEATVIKISFAA